MQNRPIILFTISVIVSWSLALSAVHIHPQVDIGPHKDGPVIHQQANYCTACACQLSATPVASQTGKMPLHPTDTVIRQQYSPPSTPVYYSAGGRSPPLYIAA